MPAEERHRLCPPCITLSARRTAPARATAAHHLTPMPLYTLGFRGYTIRGAECILPPLCQVTGGIFTMGSDKSKDAQVYDNEIPQHQIEVDPFTIDQYPVTVAEYSCFVRASQKQPIDWPIQLGKLDHHVVYLSWHDAVAYALWLAKTTGHPWRLPTEAEWEKSARWDGSAARIYPWGDSVDDTRCNVYDSGIKTTTPVGSYPSGASPYCAQDMALPARQFLPVSDGLRALIFAW